MFYVPPEAFQLLSGEEHLGGYQFGSKSGTHHFCQVCGVFTFFESHFAGRHQFGINAACIDGFDPYTAKAELIDGRSFQICFTDPSTTFRSPSVTYPRP